jgi:chondroitin AC lyase
VLVKIVALQSADGTWPDIDYADKSPAAWAPADHFVRVKDLSRAVSDPQSPLYNDKATMDAINRALDNWVAHRYQCPNWFFNQITVPWALVDIETLLGDRLSADRKSALLAVIDQTNPLPPAGGGANTLWFCQINLVAAALYHDPDRMSKNASVFSNEIHVNANGIGEGIQDDYSFHQHGPRLQQFHYGGSMLSTVPQIAWILHGSSWEVSPAKIEVVVRYVLDGCEWMFRRNSTVPGTLDRSVTRKGTLHVDLGQTYTYLSDLSPQRASALKAVLDRQKGLAPPLVGFRSFPRSDFAAYHRPSFSFFVKTVSTRTQTTESINGENLKGHLFSCGDTYFLRTGNEYFNTLPLWNWDLVPGVTYAPDAGDVTRRPFVGSIGDGMSGATAMDLQWAVNGGANQPGADLSAKKFWACDGDAVVVLIGGLTAGTAVQAPVRTAMDQCLLQSPVVVCDQTGAMQTLSAPGAQNANLRWIYHSGLAYMPIGPVSVHIGSVTGSWHDINHGQSADTVSTPMFLPVLEQGSAPSNVSDGYVVASCASPKMAASLCGRPTWKVIENDGDCQAVSFADGKMFAAFYSPGSLNAKVRVSVDEPCLVMLSGDGIRVCDPTQLLSSVKVTLGHGSQKTLAFAPAGQTSNLVPIR